MIRLMGSLILLGFGVMFGSMVYDTIRWDDPQRITGALGAMLMIGAYVVGAIYAIWRWIGRD